MGLELFRVERNPWGQEILLGMAWDLLWLFFGAGLLFIVAHILFRIIWDRKAKNQ